MSALVRITDSSRASRHVRNVPTSDIRNEEAALVAASSTLMRSCERLKSTRPLLTIRSGADPLLGFSTLCTGNFAVGSRLPRTTAFVAIRLHARTIGPHALANGLLCRAWDRSRNQGHENG